MDRRSFLKTLGFTVLAGAASLTGMRANNVEALSKDSMLLAQAGSELGSSCKNKAKGLSRCKGHTGSCDGSWHACSGHSSSTRGGGTGCGEGKRVQCSKHGRRGETTD